jgi:hypothetical protein
MTMRAEGKAQLKKLLKKHFDLVIKSEENGTEMYAPKNNIKVFLPEEETGDVDVVQRVEVYYNADYNNGGYEKQPNGDAFFRAYNGDEFTITKRLLNGIEVYKRLK